MGATGCGTMCGCCVYATCSQILRTRDMPRVVAAAMCNLKVALQQFLDAGTYDVNAQAPGTAVTALHYDLHIGFHIGSFGIADGMSIARVWTRRCSK